MVYATNKHIMRRKTTFMRQITQIIGSLIVTFMLLTGCSNQPVDDQRAGCTNVDGKARYGLVQGISGKAKGSYVYIGEKLKGKVKITCSKDKQEIIYGRG